MAYLDTLYDKKNRYETFLRDVDKSLELLGKSIESAYDLEEISDCFTIDGSAGDSGSLVGERNTMVGYYNNIIKYVYDAIYSELNSINREIAVEENM